MSETGNIAETAGKPDPASTLQKYEHLLMLLRKTSKIAVAFSGGTDSTFLLFAASQAPVTSLLALTMKRPYIFGQEISDAQDFTRRHGIPHRIIERPLDHTLANNPPDRCYLCKTDTFRLFRQEADNAGCGLLADGTNADDTGEHRPGLRALQELGVRSPLKEAGLTKMEIRYLAKKHGLEIWNKPSNSCLLTRLPYHTEIRLEDLAMIEEAESILTAMGFRQVRVRKFGGSARIEVDAELTARLQKELESGTLTGKLLRLGFEQVSIDPEGYQTGNMDRRPANDA